MKKLLLILAVAATVCASAGHVTHSVTFNASDWSVTDVTAGDSSYVQVLCQGLDMLDQPGAPALPVKYVRLSLPYNATDVSVAWTYSGRNVTALDGKVLPCPQPAISTLDGVVGGETVEDSAIYNGSAAYPVNLSDIVTDGYFMGDNHVVTLAFHPAQYLPVSRELARYGSITATVSYSTTANPDVLTRNSETLRARERSMLKTMVANPVNVDAFAAPAVINGGEISGPVNLNGGVAGINGRPTPGFTGGDSTSGPIDTSIVVLRESEYRYSVITTRALKPAFKRLLALKRQKGYIAEVVCIEDILANPLYTEGDKVKLRGIPVYTTISDSAGILRRYLREAFRFGTRFTLMVGTKIPFRYGFRSSTYMEYDSINQTIPTDWYYSDLTTNWNRDNNSYYGEQQWYNSNTTTNHLHFDYEPDLFVGRLMANHKTDINNYTDKLLRYELNPGNGNTEYLKKVLVVQGESDFDEEDTAAYTYRSSGYAVTSIKTSGYTYPTGKLVIDAMNDHGIISIHGHGNPHSIAVNQVKGHHSRHRICAHDTCDNDSSVIFPYPEFNNGLELMNNPTRPNVFYSWSCTTTPFDIYTEPSCNYTYTGWNFGQSYTLGKDYGGVAYLGNTREGTIGDYWKEIDFWKVLQNHPSVGVAEALSKKGNGIYFAMNHNLMGDPELQVWTNVPNVYNNIKVVRSDSCITISGINSGTNATVAYSDWATQAMDSTSTGNITFNNVSPNSTVMVYQHNYLPYIAPLMLQNCNINKSQYVFASSVEAGRSIDSNRTAGDVVVKSGAEYEIEAKGDVKLMPGFSVEKNAVFSVTSATF